LANSRGQISHHRQSRLYEEGPLKAAPGVTSQ
jgi:hypothetical protein